MDSEIALRAREIWDRLNEASGKYGGVELCAVHFWSFPYTSERAKEKVIDLARILSESSCGIRVHIVSPGGVDTDMIRVARPDLAAGMIPPETVADTVSFLIGFRGLFRLRIPVQELL